MIVVAKDRQELVRRLSEKACLLRCHTLRMIYKCGKGHYGGALSAAEIVATLYFHELRIRSHQPDWPERDRFILSKGHAAPVWYAALAECGFFPISWLETFKQMGSRLQGHPDMTKTPGVDMTSGALGEGLSAGVGIALAQRIDDSSSRVYVLMGDGEMQEGCVWEAILAAAHNRLGNLVAIVDRNGLQVDGPTEQIVGLGSLIAKFRAFEWQAIEVDGHDIGELLVALDQARRVSDRPTAIVARTVKGKGVSFMEGRTEWHSNTLDADQLSQALAELGDAPCEE